MSPSSLDDRASLIVFDVGAATPLIIRVESPTELWEPAKMRMQPVLDSMTIGLKPFGRADRLRYDGGPP